jgi:hypothetical protein
MCFLRRIRPEKLIKPVVLFARAAGAAMGRGGLSCVQKLPWNYESLSRDWPLIFHRNFHGKEEQSRKAAAPPQKKKEHPDLGCTSVLLLLSAPRRIFTLVCTVIPTFVFGIQARRLPNQQIRECREISLGKDWATYRP